MDLNLICPQCGKQYSEGIFCSECGSKLEQVTSQSKKGIEEKINNSGQHLVHLSFYYHTCEAVEIYKLDQTTANLLQTSEENTRREYCDDVDPDEYNVQIWAPDVNLNDADMEITIDGNEIEVTQDMIGILDKNTINQTRHLEPGTNILMRRSGGHGYWYSYEIQTDESFDIHKLKLIETKTEWSNDYYLSTKLYYDNQELYLSIDEIDERWDEYHVIQIPLEETAPTAPIQNTTQPATPPTTSNMITQQPLGSFSQPIQQPLSQPLSGLDSLNEQMAAMQADLDRQMREMQERLDQMFNKK